MSRRRLIARRGVAVTLVALCAAALLVLGIVAVGLYFLIQSA